MLSDELFIQLHERYYDEVHAYSMRRLNRADADDVAAEVFIVAWRRLDKVNPEDERAWLYGIARNAIRNLKRSSDRQQRLEFRVRSIRRGEPDQPETAVLQRAQDAAVVDAVNGLREADREILLLSAWNDFSGPEIAEVLGISVNAVQQRLHRAKKRLARAMSRIQRDPSVDLASEEGMT